ncbi:MAG: hypothetical protein EXR47_08820 [Dehalococcoidia bacterium]|nr:hypothetical protein [Dehalococcoidia bacterium]
MRTGLVLVALFLALVVACGGGDAATKPKTAVDPAPDATAQKSPLPQAQAKEPERTPPSGTTTPAPPTSSAGTGQSDRSALRIEAPVLRIAVPRMGVLNATVQVAQKGGMFESNSLSVTLVDVADSQVAVQALLSGQVQFAVVTLQDAARTSDGANPLRAVAGVLGSQPYNVALADAVAQRLGLLETSRLAERLAALKGLRLAVPQEPLAEATARALVSAAGLASADVKLVPTVAAQLLEVLKAGEVDGIVAAHPILERAIVEQGAKLVVNLSRGEVTELEPFPWLVLATTQRFATAAPDATVAVVLAIWNAERQIRRDPTRSQELLAGDYASLGAEIYRESARIYFPAVPNIPLLTPSSYSKVFRVLGGTPAPFLQVVDNKYIEVLIPHQ